MRALRLLPAFLVAGLLACEPGTPTEVAAPDSPLFDITDAPDVAGIIVRGEDTYAVTWADRDAGMRVVLGLDLEGVLAFCSGGTFDFDVIPFQDAVLPDGRLVTLYQGEMNTTVWPFTPFNCDLFTRTTPLATGVADVIYTDSDLHPNSDPVTNNPSVFGPIAHGTLVRSTGESAVFSGHWRVMNPSGSGAFLLSAQIILE